MSAALRISWGRPPSAVRVEAMSKSRREILRDLWSTLPSTEYGIFAGAGTINARLRPNPAHSETWRLIFFNFVSRRNLEKRRIGVGERGMREASRCLSRPWVDALG